MTNPVATQSRSRPAIVTGRLAPTRSLAEARRKRTAGDSCLEVLVFDVKAQSPFEQQGLFFGALRIGQATLDRADGLAGLVIVEPDALSAELWIDDVDVVAFADGFVGALGFASAAVDAVRRDVRRHGALATRGPPLF